MASSSTLGIDIYSSNELNYHVSLVVVVVVVVVVVAAVMVCE